MSADTKPVAAIVTEYRQNSHADTIVGRILEGFNFDGKAKPALRLVSLYTDQVPQNDWSRPLAKKHGVTIYETIEGAVTLGKNDVSVEGVLCIGEHGDYPTNEKGQVLYPRRRFFEQVALALEKHNRPVPVFNDKHLSYNWDDAKWMYERARQLMVPLMAGSALPVTWRVPPLRLELGTRISEAVVVAYGDVESYGFHALETLQCMVERRRGGECGVTAVQCLEGPAVWRAERHFEWSAKLRDAALGVCPGAKKGSPIDNCGDRVAAFLIDYCDGLKATVLILNGHLDQFGFAARLRGVTRGVGIRANVAACRFHLQEQRPYGHFAHLVRAIEDMVLTGHPAYPVERTLLTTGILDALMTSRQDGHKPIETPHLRTVRYEPVDYPFAADPIPG
ncbi:MAG: hypothetical protein HY000_01975 [Planctomycetes bacterium]|nr:hypothetical protein [Planctomycetota bacterium]